MDFLYSWGGMAVMALLLVALVGVLIYVRKKGADE